MTNKKPDAGLRRRPSMADVGARAGVSAQTVSRFFTGGYVSRDTRARIEAAVGELGYRQNRLARHLRVQRTDTVGFLAMGDFNWANGEMLTGLSHAVREGGMMLVTAAMDLEPSSSGMRGAVRQAIDEILQLQVDGLIMGTPYPGFEDAIDAAHRDVPIVMMAETGPPEADLVRVDSHGAAFTATQRLISLGHTRILHVTGPLATNEATERLRGYRDALAAAGISNELVHEGDSWGPVTGVAAIQQVGLERFTGIIASNDAIATGIISEATKRGLSAPRDFSLVGTDDMPICAFLTPPLTTVRLDFRALGRTAFEMLMARIRTGDRQPEQTIPAVVVERESDGPPRK